MIKFNNIIIEGFCSIPKYTLNLNSGDGITIVRGPNGYGKSSLFAAISWVCYGKTSKGVNNVNTWDSVKPKDYKGTKVQIFFTKNNVTYSIIRCQNYKDEVFGAKGKDRLILLEDGIEVSEKSKPQIQQKINKILGMSYELFNNSLMFGQGVKRLIQESGSDKKKLFEEVFELEYLNIAKQLASNEMSEVRDEIEHFELELNNLKSNLDDSISTYKKLRSSERNFKKDISKKRKEIQKKIKICNDKLKSLKFNEKLLAKKKKKLANLKDGLAILNKEYSENKSKLSYESLQNIVSESLKHLKANEVNKAFIKMTNLLSILDQVNLFSSRKEYFLSKIEKVRDDLYEEEDKQSEYDNLLERIEEYKDSLKSLKCDKEILSTEYKEKYKKIKEKLEKLKEKYNIKLKEYENYTWLIRDPLGNKGIKSYIMESSLDFLNRTLDSYSDTLGFRIEFGIDLESTKKDFYTLIQIRGTYADYNELSGGQKQLVNIAMAFAMHESQSMSKGMNILFLDEVFESLSRDNIELVVELLKKMATDKNIYLITHHDSLPIGNCKVLNVRSNNGLTEFD